MMISLVNLILMLLLLLVLKPSKLKLFSTIAEIQFGNGLLIISYNLYALSLSTWRF